MRSDQDRFCDDNFWLSRTCNQVVREAVECVLDGGETYNENNTTPQNRLCHNYKSGDILSTHSRIPGQTGTAAPNNVQVANDKIDKIDTLAPRRS